MREQKLWNFLLARCPFLILNIVLLKKDGRMVPLPFVAPKVVGYRHRRSSYIYCPLDPLLTSPRSSLLAPHPRGATTTPIGVILPRVTTLYLILDRLGIRIIDVVKPAVNNI